MDKLSRFDQAFWGTDYLSTAGFDTLSKRVNDGRSLCKDIESYFKNRAKMETEYSKSLASLSKSLKVRDNIGQLEFSFNSFSKEIEQTVKLHHEAAVFFSQLAEETKKFIDDANSNKKAIDDKVKRTQQVKATSYNKMTTAKKAYIQKCKDSDTAKHSLADMDRSVTVTIKDLEKARNLNTKCQDQRTTTDQKYKDSVKLLENARESWEREFSTACESFQKMEEERIVFLRDVLWTSVNVDSKIALETDESGARVRELLDKCDVLEDICSFIERFKTGENRPLTIPYESYYTESEPNDGHYASVRM